MHKSKTAHLQPSKRALQEYGQRCKQFSYGCVSCEGWLYFDRTGRAPYFTLQDPDPVSQIANSRSGEEMCSPEMDWATAVVEA